MLRGNVKSNLSYNLIQICHKCSFYKTKKKVLHYLKCRLLPRPAYIGNIWPHATPVNMVSLLNYDPILCSTFRCWCLSAQEEFEDTKGVINICKSKDRQHNHKKGTYNDLQNTTHKTKDRATRTSLKTGGELRCSGRVSRSCSTSTSLYVHQILLLSVYNISITSKLMVSSQENTF